MEEAADVRNPERRWFITKLARRTALAGLGVLTLGRLLGRDAPAEAADNSPLLIGKTNSGSSTTFLDSSPTGINAAVFQTKTTSPDGVGVSGTADSTGASSIGGLPIGIAGYTTSPHGTGVNGHAGSKTGKNTGTVGHTNSPDGVGVFGFVDTSSPGTVAGKPIAVAGYTLSPTGRGVDGNAAATSGITYGVTGEVASPQGTAVSGFAASTKGNTRGVAGVSKSPDGVGVHAANLANGNALRVDGKASFSRSGVAAVLLGQASTKITGVPLSPSSLVLANMQQNQAGVFVQAVVPDRPTSSFTIYLSKACPANTKVAWFVLN